MKKHFDFGDVVITTFPYVTGAAGKKRPALVLIDTDDDDLIIAVITSKRRNSSYDIAISNWKTAQLLFPSTVRVHKIFTKEKRTILGRLGKLGENDRKKIKTTARKLWSELG